MDDIKVSNKKRAAEYIKRLIDGGLPKQMVEITHQEEGTHGNDGNYSDCINALIADISVYRAGH